MAANAATPTAARVGILLAKSVSWLLAFSMP